MLQKKKYSSQCPSWLDTYADMVTLLLTFFVLLFAMSTMNSSKWKQLVEAFQKNAGTYSETASAISGNAADSSLNASSNLSSGEAGDGTGSEEQTVTEVTNFDDLYPYFKQYVEDNNLQSQIQLYQGDNYTFLCFTNSIFFDGNSAELKSESAPILNYFCDAVSKIPDQIGEIRFYGHTAKVSEDETAEQQAFDRSLSDDRAKNVLLYVQLKNIIESGKLVSAGYGEFRPAVADDGTEATRAKNRRVEIYISKAGETEDDLSKIYSEIYSGSSSN